jgi:D-serine deaminase-like pyridoxal phosphate-dependent protein
MKKWFEIEEIEEVDSPSIILFEDRLMYNLNQMINMVGEDTTKLMPHIKTNKMPKVIERMISMNIKSFKASTIAEAEIAASAGAEKVLIAHQLVGPKIRRFAELITYFPNTEFATLIDNIDSAKKLNTVVKKDNITANVFIDINNGMHRSGVQLGIKLNELLDQLPAFKNLYFKGLHVYDGHLRGSDSKLRWQNIEHDIDPVISLFGKLKRDNPKLELICGGTPSFTGHNKQPDRICSPGTCLLWDWGYGDQFLEQEFKYAALLITRVISKPKEGLITIDLGHKSVAAENPIDKRVRFLNLSDYELLSQSEEHGVLSVKDWDKIKVGDVYYGLPYHICPTINLHDEVSVIVNGRKVGQWDITARARKISI